MSPHWTYGNKCLCSVRYGAAKMFFCFFRISCGDRTPLTACLSYLGDGVCKSEGLGQNEQVRGGFTRSADLDTFWAHWRYNLEDPGCEFYSS